jgi:prevent-host-death family protein
MKTVGVAELKNHLSEHLARVAKGEPLLVRSRTRILAKIVPVDAAEDEAVDRLVREGLAEPAEAARRPALPWPPPGAPEDGAAALEGLIEERRSGR